jgi:hypothetical protein
MAERITVTEVLPDGTLKESSFEMPPELEARLNEARAEWKRLEEAGTPYWCVHKDRDVSHPRAQWKDDTPDDPIHRKHGVMCLDCGGYIQEG